MNDLEFRKIKLSSKSSFGDVGDRREQECLIRSLSHEANVTDDEGTLHVIATASQAIAL